MLSCLESQSPPVRLVLSFASVSPVVTLMAPFNARITPPALLTAMLLAFCAVLRLMFPVSDEINPALWMAPAADEKFRLLTACITAELVLITEPPALRERLPALLMVP